MGLKRLKSGKWQVDERISGVRKRFSFLTKKEALDFIKGLKVNKSIPSQLLPNYKPKNLRNAIESYFNFGMSDNVEQTKLEKVNHIKELGDFLFRECCLDYIHECELLHLEKIRKHWLEKGLKKSSINRRFNNIKHFFRFCIVNKYIPENPCKDLKSLREKPNIRRTWNLNQAKQFIDKVPEKYQPFIWFLWNTGTRPSNAERLKWKDIDFKNKTLTLITIKGSGEIEQQKFPLFDKLNCVISKLHVQSKKNQVGKKTDPVFWDYQLNKQMSAKSVSRQASRTINELANIDSSFEGLVLYGMRHTFASYLLSIGYNIETVRLLMGHRKITTTQQYVHLLENKALMEAVEKASERNNIIELNLRERRKA